MLAGKKEGGPRWARGQKFTLSSLGREAMASHRSAVLGARGAGRTALEAALAGWATPLGVAPGDGVLLGELEGKPPGLQDLVRALEHAGIGAAEVREALARLVEAGLVELVPLASQLPPERPPVHRW